MIFSFPTKMLCLKVMLFYCLIINKSIKLIVLWFFTGIIIKNGRKFSHHYQVHTEKMSWYSAQHVLWQRYILTLHTCLFLSVPLIINKIYLHHYNFVCHFQGSLLSVLRQFSRLKSDKQAISVGFVGYPNVGKSSVINALRTKNVMSFIPSIFGMN